MKTDEQVMRELAAQQQGKNVMGGERFQIVRREYKLVEPGAPSVLDSVTVGKIENF